MLNYFKNLDGGQEGGAEKNEERSHLDQTDHECERTVNWILGNNDQ